MTELMNPEISKNVAYYVKETVEPVLGAKIKQIVYMSQEGLDLEAFFVADKAYYHARMKLQPNGGSKLSYHLIENPKEHMTKLQKEAQPEAKTDAYQDLSDQQRWEFDEAMEQIALDGPFTKAQVMYTHPAPDADKGMKCFNCAYKAVDSPEDKPLACVLVQGIILADGICVEALIPATFIEDGEPNVGVNDLSKAPAG